MAENKTTTKKSPATPSSKSSTSRSSSKSKAALEKERQRLREEALERERHSRRIKSVVMFVVGIFLTLCAVIPGNIGEGWRGLFDFMHGMFGYSAFVVGPAVIYIAVLLSADKPQSMIRKSVVGLVLLGLLVSAAVQILVVGVTQYENMADFFGKLYVAGYEFRGGGVLAMVIGEPLLLLGQLGASIVIILLVLIYFLIVSKMTVVDFVHRISDPVKKTKNKVVESHKRRVEDRALANEEFERLEQERILAEIDKEVAERENAERLSRIAHSVDEDVKAEASKQVTPNAAGKSVPQESPKETKPEPPNILKEQTDDSKEYMKALQDFIMEKNKDVIAAAEKDEKDPLEDSDAELVPIVDAINRFKEEEHTKSRVREIVDAPIADISTSDEAELPFDIEDVVQTEPVAPTPMSGKIPQIERAERTPEPPVKKENPQPRTESVQTKSNSDQPQIKLSEVYTLPPVTLLNPVEKKITQHDIEAEIKRNSETLVDTLKSFGVQTKFIGVSRGPSVTRYELQPAPGVKITKITNLVDDIALNLATAGVRIEAPIPNKAAVGIEVPNKQKDTVSFRELVDNSDFKKSFDKKLETVLGKDISGETVTCNISKMPHLLIAGTTGSGKSVCVNSIIMSMLMKSTPEEVRLIMIDPKKVEFMMYNGIPHLLIPVVTDPKKAAGALAWAVNEMLNRYKMFSENNVRDFSAYNQLASDPDSGLKKMSHIVIFIDELADLMMASPKDVEDSIVRLAQMARAAGMHLVIATQRPTVNVVTGLIKSNIPSRIALMVASQTDSRVILDTGGAEKLLGNGDMLYMPVGMPKPLRVQGCFVSDKEVERTVEFIKQTTAAEYDESIMEEIERQTEMVSGGDNKSAAPDDGDFSAEDEKLEEAIEYVVEAGTASTSALQRRFKLGYGRAARLIDIMEQMGVVGPFEGSKPRQVLMTKQEWYERKLQQK